MFMNYGSGVHSVVTAAAAAAAAVAAAAAATATTEFICLFDYIKL